MHAGAPIKIEFRDICFQRVRANGQILYKDCEYSRLTSDSGPAWSTPASRLHLPAVHGLRGICPVQRGGDLRPWDIGLLAARRATTWEFLHIPKPAGTSIEAWGFCIGYLAERRRTDRLGIPWDIKDCGDEGGWRLRLPPSYPATLSGEMHPKICPTTAGQDQTGLMWDFATQDTNTRSWALFDKDAWAETRVR